MVNVVVDVSHHQALIDFTEVVAQGIVGLFHKATEGTPETQGPGSVDPCYLHRVPLAKSVGLLWGAYHFGTGTDGTAQAQHFLATVQPGPTDLLMLDFEPNLPGQPSMTAAQAEAFVQEVYAQTRRYPGLYGTTDYLLSEGADQYPGLKSCWLWVARYANLTEPPIPPAWRTWTLWQYTDGVAGMEPMAVPGIGPCDRDQFNGPLEDLYRLWNCPVPASVAAAAGA